jgi:hypothetical protein
LIQFTPYTIYFKTHIHSIPQLICLKYPPPVPTHLCTNYPYSKSSGSPLTSGLGGGGSFFFFHIFFLSTFFLVNNPLVCPLLSLPKDRSISFSFYFFPSLHSLLNLFFLCTEMLSGYDVVECDVITHFFYN